MYSFIGRLKLIITMLRIAALLFLLFSCNGVIAQISNSPDSLTIKSLADLDALLADVDSADTPKSYIDISIGLGNKEFSQRNNAVNAGQNNITQLYYTPSLSYFHKSGFGLSVIPYLTNLNGNFKLYQTALNPSYSYANKSIVTSLSYTHYFADNKSYYTNSTFQNELYAFLRYKKWYLEPSLSLGFSSGKYNQINLDSIRIFGQNRLIKDSTKNTIKDFTVAFGVEHSFEFSKFLTKNDNITLTPQLILTGGTERYSTTHVNQIYARLANRPNSKIRSLSSTENAPFAIQSLAFSFTAFYEIGNFYLSPNVYSDYYLPSTTEKRLNTVFSFTFGYTF